MTNQFTGNKTIQHQSDILEVKRQPRIINIYFPLGDTLPAGKTGGCLIGRCFSSAPRSRPWPVSEDHRRIIHSQSTEHLLYPKPLNGVQSVTRNSRTKSAYDHRANNGSDRLQPSRAASSTIIKIKPSPAGIQYGGRYHKRLSLPTDLKETRCSSDVNVGLHPITTLKCFPLTRKDYCPQQKTMA